MKLTPLTTRPSLTSRQGMTRTLNMSRRLRRTDQLQSFGRIEPAVIERAADDGAGEFFRARLQQGMHIVERSEAARGDDRDRDFFGKHNRRIEIEPLEHAVAADIGIDESSDAGVFKALRDIERGEF